MPGKALSQQRLDRVLGGDVDFRHRARIRLVPDLEISAVSPADYFSSRLGGSQRGLQMFALHPRILPA
jgi:hypothetical protein